MTAKIKQFIFDLECTTQEPAHAYICSMCSLDLQDEELVELVYRDENHEETIKDIINKIWSKPKKSIFYAHNLGYDISFILSYFKDKIHPDEYQISNPILVGMVKSYLAIDITYNGKLIKFRDTYALFTAPLASVLKAYTKLKKLSNTPLFPHASDIVIDEELKQYSKRDTFGLALALSQRRTVGGGKMTTASDAMSVFKKLFNDKHKNNFLDFFPLIPSETDKKMRKAYAGGFTYLNAFFKDKKINNVHVIDVNSMYPSVMKDEPLPYGQPYEYTTGEVELDSVFTLKLQRLSFNCCSIKDGCVPFISPEKNCLRVNTYPTDIESQTPLELRTILLTGAELELFIKCYDISGLKYLGGYAFKSRRGFFDDYISMFWSMKLNPDPVISSLGKLFLNSLYGKFAEGYDNNVYEVNYIDGKGLSSTVVEINSKEKGYLPIAIFITSFARIKLIECILEIGMDYFIYCDTDSIHFIAIPLPASIKISKIIGEWSMDAIYREAKYLGAKKYIGVMGESEGYNLKGKEGELKITCSGIKKNSIQAQVRCIDDFYSGRAIETFRFTTGVNGRRTVKTMINI